MGRQRGGARVMVVVLEESDVLRAGVVALLCAAGVPAVGAVSWEALPEPQRARTALVVLGRAAPPAAEVPTLRLPEDLVSVTGGDVVDQVRRAVRPSTAFGLSRREREVLQLIAQGWPNADIGAALGIAEKTVRQHATRVFAKLGVTNRVQAATKWHETETFVL